MAEETRTSEEVGIPSPEYEAMAESWELVDALIAGTRAMRERKWLHQNVGESDKTWGERSARSVLFNAYSDAIRNTLARPFSRDVTIMFPDEVVPPALDRFVNATDAEGRDLTAFERRVMFEKVHRGLVHVLVDMPARRDDEQTGTRLDDLRMQPYQVIVSAKDLIGWTESKDDSGMMQLDSIRYIERTKVGQGYQQEVQENIRVWRRDGSWELWAPQKVSSGMTQSWLLIAEDKAMAVGGKPLNRLPLVTDYANRTGFMQGRPAFEDLAWVNLQHFNRDSGLNWILSILDSPTLFEKCIETANPAQDIDKQVPRTLGPNSKVTSDNPDADMRFVEHSGSAVGKSMENIQKLEDRMERYGLRPLQLRLASATATGQAISENRSSCDVQEWAISQERSLEDRLQLAAEWAGITLHEDTRVDLFTDFEAVGPMAEADFNHILAMRQAGDITRLTTLREGKRRGKFDPNFDPEVEAEDAQSEADMAWERQLELAGSRSNDGPDDDDSED